MKKSRRMVKSGSNDEEGAGKTTAGKATTGGVSAPSADGKTPKSLAAATPPPPTKTSTATAPTLSTEPKADPASSSASPAQSTDHQPSQLEPELKPTIVVDQATPQQRPQQEPPQQQQQRPLQLQKSLLHHQQQQQGQPQKRPKSLLQQPKPKSPMQRFSLPLSSSSSSSSTPKSLSSLMRALHAQRNQNLSPQQLMYHQQQQQHQQLQLQDLPKSVTCAACSATVPVSLKVVKRHPKLHIVVCASCYRFYHSGKWVRDADGHFIHCQCCADGGNMVCCSRCDQVACRSCLKRLLGRRELASALEKDWQCLICHPQQMSSFVLNSRRAFEALKLKAAAAASSSSSDAARFPSSPAASSSSSSSVASNHSIINGFANSITAFNSPRPPGSTINAYFPVAQRRNNISAAAGSIPDPLRAHGDSSSSASLLSATSSSNLLVATTKNLADDFMDVDEELPHPTGIGAASSEAHHVQNNEDDDDVVIIGSNSNHNNNNNNDDNKKGLNGNNAIRHVSNAIRPVKVQRNVNNAAGKSSKSMEDGVRYLDQRLKNWRSLLDKMIVEHAVNGQQQQHKGRLPLSPRSLKPGRPSLKRDLSAMVAKMKKEIESLERNLLFAQSSVQVINVVPDSFKPPAIPQRHSPDLHGGWLLPHDGQIDARRKTRNVVHLDDDDDDDDDDFLDDDSDEEVEKAVIRVGANFQATVPETKSSSGDAGDNDERPEDMLLWHPYGMEEAKTEAFLNEAAIAAKGDLQLALYLLMKSDFDSEAAINALRQQQQLQQPPAPPHKQQPQQQKQPKPQPAQRGADDAVAEDDDDDDDVAASSSSSSSKTPEPEAPSETVSSSLTGIETADPPVSSSPSSLSSSSSSSSSTVVAVAPTSSSSSSTVVASPSSSSPLKTAQSLITKFLTASRGDSSDVSSPTTTETTTTTATMTTTTTTGVPSTFSNESSAIASSGSIVSTRSASSAGVASPHKYVASLNIINGVVGVLEPRHAASGASSSATGGLSLDKDGGAYEAMAEEPGERSSSLPSSPLPAASSSLIEAAPRVRRWTEAECYAFECGLRANGKDFNAIQRFRLPNRTVGEIVQFYYLWKKTERRNFVDL